MNDESYMDSDEIEEMPDEYRNGLRELLERMQRQLTFLEKKLDMLLSRSEGERSFENARPAHKPHRKPYDRQFQQFDRPPRHSRNDGDDRERGFRNKENSRDHFYERRKTTKKPGGKPTRSGFGKKPFHSRYSD
ncbi:MAG: hypothetical protein FWF13_06965 [Acidobacteria bacterium]|nr:hypothetical protein [Acidobacteriota bacterium]